jgi:hypothetical protein
MSKEKDAFIKDLKERIEYNPKEEDARKCEAAEKYYKSLRGGNIRRHVTTTMALYTSQVLPELSLEQVIELTDMVHNTIQTVLTYLVEDGLIKEE